MKKFSKEDENIYTEYQNCIGKEYSQYRLNWDILIYKLKKECNEKNN